MFVDEVETSAFGCSEEAVTVCVEAAELVQVIGLAVRISRRGGTYSSFALVFPDRDYGVVALRLVLSIVNIYVLGARPDLLPDQETSVLGRCNHNPPLRIYACGISSNVIPVEWCFRVRLA